MIWKLLQTVILAASALAGTVVVPCASIAATSILDNSHTDVSFTYYVGFISQSGHFSQIKGVFQFDPHSPHIGSINAVIRTESLTASAWESEMKGPDFFNVAVFPEIRFQSRSAKLLGADTAEFTGELTMNGVTRPVTLLAKLGNGRHVSAMARIKRSAFNMTALSFLIADDIDIRIEGDLLEN